jgi:membrane protease YdiL (CAAX protease family)
VTALDGTWPWVAAVLALLVLVNLLDSLWWQRGYLVTAPVAAVLLLWIGRRAGLGWQDLGLGRVQLARGLAWAGGAVLLVAVAYAVAARLPFARAAAAGAPAGGAGVARALAEVTFGTVLLEEIAFRGVLWGLVSAERGALTATVVTSALFGLWHVVPALVPTGTGEGVVRPGPLATAPWGGAAWAVGTVVVTALAGVVFAELRRRSGSLLAPMGLHWAFNALGVLFRVAVHRQPPRPDRATTGQEPT